ncbi:MAG: tetratricopeptide repeat protein, partial [Treponema sp.]|nr:tetratricopeptide repeat protein [Treponema sp.]
DYKSTAYLKLAQIACRKKQFAAALDFAKESLYAGYKNYKARNIITIIHRTNGDAEKARARARETLDFDPMDFAAHYELARLGQGSVDDFWRLLRNNAHNFIALARDYGELGFYGDSAAIIKKYLENGKPAYAMACYYLAFWLEKNGDPAAAEAWKNAAEADGTWCFPNSLEDLAVLNRAARNNESDWRARYYLGCLLYDKKRYADAAGAWEKSAALNPNFPTTRRNLGLYYANKQKDFNRARAEFEKAFELDPGDARLFYELCELYKRIGLPLKSQLELYEKHRDLVMKRDDLCVSYAEILNALGRYETALELLLTRKFHPWEGGEGKVPAQHIEARIGIARKLMAEGKNRDAAAELEKAAIYYENFGEGKLPGAQENHIYYHLGLALREIDPRRSAECFEKASTGISEPAGAMYYNDQPPHLIYYQGLALRALGREDEARSRFNKLIAYGEKHLFKKQTMDYFAVSLPDFLVFEVDLDEKNRVHCYYMMALGHLGLGDDKKAGLCFDKLFELSPNHFGALSHRKR